MPFKLSQRSLERLVGVKPQLAEIVKLAIDLTTVDFGVVEGLRTLETQKRYVETGKSQTMNSKHLTGDAVDLVVYIDGQVSWELNVYDNLADAMKTAAAQKGVGLKWGAAWNVPDIRNWQGSMEAAMNHYIDERRKQGRRPFIDAPHFELV